MAKRRKGDYWTSVSRKSDRRRKSRANETEEQRELRLYKQKMYVRQKRSMETPEMTAERHARCRVQQRQSRQNHTSKQRSLINQIKKLQQRERRSKIHKIDKKLQTSQTFHLNNNEKERVGGFLEDNGDYLQCALKFSRVPCPVCYNLFTETYLPTHILSHVSKTERRFKCNLCPSTYQNINYLKQHRKKCHTTQHRMIVSQFSCEVCSTVIHRKQNYVNHINLHRKANEIDLQDDEELFFYLCDNDTCLLNFRNKDQWEKHMATHTPNFSCDKCHRTFSMEHNLRIHIEGTHEQVDGGVMDAMMDCPYCAEISKVTDFESHTKRHSFRLNEFEKDIGSLLCDECGRTFSAEKFLDKHQELVHEIPKIRSSKQYPKKKCKICEKMCQSEKILTSHYLNVHTYEHGLICYICNKRFSTLRILGNHFHWHNKDVPILTNRHNCDYCTKVFAGYIIRNKHHFLAHAKNYLSDRPFHCIVCFRNFSTEEEKELHYDIHRKWKCSICSLHHISKKMYDEHMKLHETRPGNEKRGWGRSTQKRIKKFEEKLKETGDPLDSAQILHNTAAEAKRRINLSQQNYMALKGCSSKKIIDSHQLANEESELTETALVQDATSADFSAKQTMAFSNISLSLLDQTNDNPTSIAENSFMSIQNSVDNSKHLSVTSKSPEKQNIVQSEDVTTPPKMSTYFRKIIVIPEKRYKCGRCSQQYSNSLLLLRHLRWHIADAAGEPNPISPSFVQIIEFERSEARKYENPNYDVTAPSIPIFKCDICAKRFRRLKDLINHRNGIHGQQTDEIQPELGLPFKCDLCPQQFILEVYLKRHKNRIHSATNIDLQSLLKTRSQKLSPRRIRNRKTKISKKHLSFTCPICPITYRSKILFDNHKKLHHANELAKRRLLNLRKDRALEIKYQESKRQKKMYLQDEDIAYEYDVPFARNEKSTINEEKWKTKNLIFEKTAIRMNTYSQKDDHNATTSSDNYLECHMPGDNVQSSSLPISPHYEPYCISQDEDDNCWLDRVEEEDPLAGTVADKIEMRNVGQCHAQLKIVDISMIQSMGNSNKDNTTSDVKVEVSTDAERPINDNNYLVDPDMFSSFLLKEEQEQEQNGSFILDSFTAHLPVMQEQSSISLEFDFSFYNPKITSLGIVQQRFLISMSDLSENLKRHCLSLPFAIVQIHDLKKLGNKKVKMSSGYSACAFTVKENTTVSTYGVKNKVLHQSDSVTLSQNKDNFSTKLYTNILAKLPPHLQKLTPEVVKSSTIEPKKTIKSKSSSLVLDPSFVQTGPKSIPTAGTQQRNLTIGTEIDSSSKTLSIQPNQMLEHENSCSGYEDEDFEDHSDVSWLQEDTSSSTQSEVEPRMGHREHSIGTTDYSKISKKQSEVVGNTLSTAKKFECRLCEVKFYHNTTLKYHLRRKHGLSPSKTRTSTKRHCVLDNFCKTANLKSGVVSLERIPSCQRSDHFDSIKNKNDAKLNTKKMDSMQRTESEETGESTNKLRTLRRSKRNRNKTANKVNDGKEKIEVDLKELNSGKNRGNKNKSKEICAVSDEVFESNHNKSDEASVISQKQPKSDGESNNNEFACTACSNVFRRPYDLSRHIKRRHPTAHDLRCDICTKSFPTYAGMKTHKRYVHERNGKLKDKNFCDLCNRSFPLSINIAGHIEKMHKSNPTPYACVDCDKKFAIRTTYRRHQEKFHGKRGQTPFTYVHTPLSIEFSSHYSCDFCDLVLVGRKRYNRHIRQHVNLDSGLNERIVLWTFLCDAKDCKKMFRLKHLLLSHMESHNEESGLSTCTVCQKSFAEVGNLEKHMQQVHGDSTKTFDCPYCVSCFETAEILRRHQEKHKVDLSLPLAGIHMCDTCGKDFTRVSTMNAHIVREHGPDRPLDPRAKPRMDNRKRQTSDQSQSDTECPIDPHPLPFVQREKGMKKKWVRCKHCTLVLSDKSILYKHLYTQHTAEHLKEFPYRCDLCLAPFVTETDALAHKTKIHDPLKCEYCGKQFNRTAYLKSHILGHTGERPFGCSFCDKTFTYVFNLRDHEKRHKKEFSVFCKVCQGEPVGFYRKVHLDQHMSNVHGAGETVKQQCVKNRTESRGGTTRRRREIRQNHTWSSSSGVAAEPLQHVTQPSDSALQPGYPVIESQPIVHFPNEYSQHGLEHEDFLQFVTN